MSVSCGETTSSWKCFTWFLLNRGIAASILTVKMSIRRAILVIVLLAGLLVGLSLSSSSADQSQPVMYQETRRQMWTKFEIVAYGSDRSKLAEAADAAFEEIDRLDRQMSNYSDA